LGQFNVSYFMVSLDTPEKNQEFAEANESGFPILSDPTGESAEAYGVGAPGGLFAKRYTFFIGNDGIIKHIERSVKIPTHGAYVAEKLEELGFEKKP
jgi:peroxiredoxin Q/BCP